MYREGIKMIHTEHDVEQVAKKIDGRKNNHGTIGNKGGGRPKGSFKADKDGSRRANFGLAVTDEENEVIRKFSKLVKKNPSLADMVLSQLSVPPAKRLYGGDRERRTFNGTPIEKEKIKQALQSIKWYYAPSKAIIDKAMALAGLE